MKDDKSTISKPVQFLYIKLVMSHRENLHSERIGILNWKILKERKRKNSILLRTNCTIIKDKIFLGYNEKQNFKKKEEN